MVAVFSELNADGVEVSVATNYLGHFHLANRLVSTGVMGSCRHVSCFTCHPVLSSLVMCHVSSCALAAPPCCVDRGCGRLAGWIGRSRCRDVTTITAGVLCVCRDCHDRRCVCVCVRVCVCACVCLCVCVDRGKGVGVGGIGVMSISCFCFVSCASPS